MARSTYRLPYFWAAMDLDRRGNRISYSCRRRWPGPGRASSIAQVTIGDRYGEDELDGFDHYLTARWRLFSSAGRRHRMAHAWHEPWPLRRAELIHLHDELTGAAGLPAPSTEPVVHYSDGVDVRIGRPEPAGRAS